MDKVHSTCKTARKNKERQNTDDEEPTAGVAVKTPDDAPAPKSGGNAEDLPVEV